MLARLPISNHVWRRLGVFRNGRMDEPDYALRIFRLHSERAFPDGLPQGAAVLELGPGDSVASAVIARAHGAGRTYLVDVADFADGDMSFYKRLAEMCRQAGLSPPDLSSVTSIGELLDCCNAEYLTGGLESLKSIEDASIDLAWSHSVLEHVRKHEFASVQRELRRVVKPTGYASHNIDFQDHLDHALNNLRFSEQLWESPFFSDAGFYTNRIPAPEMHRAFGEAGFEIAQEGFGRWPSLPIKRAALDRSFARFSDSDLSIRTSHALLKPRQDT